MSKRAKLLSLLTVVIAFVLAGAVASRASGASCLYYDEILDEGEYLESPNGDYQFQNWCGSSAGCWLVVWNVAGQYAEWQNYSEVNAQGADIVVMQSDGNLVQYDTDTNPWTPIWATGTDGYPTSRACVQDDSNFVVYYFSNAIWSIW